MAERQKGLAWPSGKESNRPRILSFANTSFHSLWSTEGRHSVDRFKTGKFGWR
jgi:hypothetical protein